MILLNVEKKDSRLRNRELTEKKIIEAAYELFAEKGFKAATMRMISKKSGSNITLISRYFGSKDELFNKIVEIKFNKFNDFYVDYSDAETYEELLDIFFKEALTLLYNNKKYFRMIFLQAFSDSKYSKGIEKIHESGERRFTMILEDFTKARSLKADIDFSIVSRITFNFLRGLIVKYLMETEGDNASLEKEIKIFINTICHKKGLSYF